MARYRTHTVEFKRQVVGEHLNGGTSLNESARRHDLSRELLRKAPTPWQRWAGSRSWIGII